MSDWAFIKTIAAAGDHIGALAALRRLARHEDDFVTQRKYARLVNKLPKDGLELQPLKLALLASSTTDHFAEILRLWLALEGFDADRVLTDVIAAVPVPRK